MDDKGPDLFYVLNGMTAAERLAYSKKYAPPIPREELREWEEEIRAINRKLDAVRALLTSGPVSPRHMPFTAGACANDEWVAAIRKALGE